MRKTNTEGFIPQSKKTNWDQYIHDGDELIFFEPKKRKRSHKAGELPEVKGAIKVAKKSRPFDDEIEEEEE